LSPRPRLGRFLVALTVAPLATAACEHAAPGAVRAPADVGPSTTSLPRRLTFSALNDRTPSVTGNVIVYARQGDAYANPTYSPLGREECLAFLPVEGGTIQRLYCPHSLLSPADSYVNTWFEPSLSPDGTRIAFTWQRGPKVGPESFWYAFLMVTAADRPADTTQIRRFVTYTDTGPPPRHADFASRVTWVGSDRLRFLATAENISVVNDSGTTRTTDTAYVPLALMELDLVSGTMGAVPGGDLAIAYAAAPSGGIWVVRGPHPDSLLLLDPATGVRTPVGQFSSTVLDLIAVDGAPVAVVDGGGAIERLDPQSGARTRLTGFAGPVRHIAAAGGRRLVAEIEQATLPFGAPSDLWLLEFP
jgi:hypothetical protein